jgi:uncharacterized protein YndB with AHSA1/START domain
MPDEPRTTDPVSVPEVTVDRTGAAELAGAPDHPAAPDPIAEARVTRAVDIAAGADDVWSAVADPALRETWLDDPDAADRTVRVDEVDAGRRLVWTWWRSDGDDPGASTVEIALRPLDGGGTRVVVTETLAVALPAAVLTPAPTARTSGASVRASATASVTARPVAAGRAWDRRLLGLELLFVGVLAAVR